MNQTTTISSIINSALVDKEVTVRGERFIVGQVVLCTVVNGMMQTLVGYDLHEQRGGLNIFVYPNEDIIIHNYKEVE